MLRLTGTVLSAACALAAASAVAQDTVTFDQVLRDPGNLQLNLSFAQQRADAGDLVAAAGALERILFAAPNWDEARLYYAGVLFRLGDHKGAARELDLLDQRSLSPTLQARAQSYRSRIDSATARTRVNGRLSVGIGHDENAAVLITEDIGGDPALQGLDQTSFIGRARLEVEHDISDARNAQLFARGDLHTKQFEDDTLDGYVVSSLRAGVRGSTSPVDYQVNGSFRNVNIQGSSYLNEAGAELAVSRDLGGATAIGAQISYHDQEFEALSGLGDPSDGRSGDRIDAAIRIRHALSGRARIHGQLSVRDKSAERDDFAYQFTGGQVGLEYFWPNNAYVDTDLLYRDYQYDGTFGVSASDRNDQYTFGRVAIGIPLALFSGGRATPDDLPLVAELAVHHMDRQSNIDLFEYDSTGAELRLVWNFKR